MASDGQGAANSNSQDGYCMVSHADIPDEADLLQGQAERAMLSGELQIDEDLIRRLERLKHPLEDNKYIDSDEECETFDRLANWCARPEWVGDTEVAIAGAQGYRIDEVLGKLADELDYPPDPYANANSADIRLRQCRINPLVREAASLNLLGEGTSRGTETEQHQQSDRKHSNPEMQQQRERPKIAPRGTRPGKSAGLKHEDSDKSSSSDDDEIRTSPFSTQSPTPIESSEEEFELSRSDEEAYEFLHQIGYSHQPTVELPLKLAKKCVKMQDTRSAINTYYLLGYDAGFRQRELEKQFESNVTEARRNLTQETSNTSVREMDKKGEEAQKEKTIEEGLVENLSQKEGGESSKLPERPCAENCVSTSTSTDDAGDVFYDASPDNDSSTVCFEGQRDYGSSQVTVSNDLSPTQGTPSETRMQSTVQEDQVELGESKEALCCDSLQATEKETNSGTCNINKWTKEEAGGKWRQTTEQARDAIESLDNFNLKETSDQETDTNDFKEFPKGVLYSNSKQTSEQATDTNGLGGLKPVVSYDVLTQTSDQETDTADLSTKWTEKIARECLKQVKEQAIQTTDELTLLASRDNLVQTSDQETDTDDFRELAQTTSRDDLKQTTGADDVIGFTQTSGDGLKQETETVYLDLEELTLEPSRDHLSQAPYQEATDDVKECKQATPNNNFEMVSRKTTYTRECKVSKQSNSRDNLNETEQGAAAACFGNFNQTIWQKKDKDENRKMKQTSSLGTLKQCTGDSTDTRDSREGKQATSFDSFKQTSTQTADADGKRIWKQAITRDGLKSTDELPIDLNLAWRRRQLEDDDEEDTLTFDSAGAKSASPMLDVQTSDELRTPFVGIDKCVGTTRRLDHGSGLTGSQLFEQNAPSTREQGVQTNLGQRLHSTKNNPASSQTTSMNQQNTSAQEQTGDDQNSKEQLKQRVEMLEVLVQEQLKILKKVSEERDDLIEYLEAKEENWNKVGHRYQKEVNSLRAYSTQLISDKVASGRSLNKKTHMTLVRAKQNHDKALALCFEQRNKISELQLQISSQMKFICEMMDEMNAAKTAAGIQQGAIKIKQGLQKRNAKESIMFKTLQCDRAAYPPGITDEPEFAVLDTFGVGGYRGMPLENAENEEGGNLSVFDCLTVPLMLDNYRKAEHNKEEEYLDELTKSVERMIRERGALWML